MFSVGSMPKIYKRFQNNREGNPREFLFEFRGSRVIEQEMARLQNYLKC
jgi:hypothetical protein